MTVVGGLAPIVLFAYRRPRHMAETLASLRANRLARDSTLYIFADGPKGEADRESVAAVHALLDRIEGFRCIEAVRRPGNLGLARNVISGVEAVIRVHGRVIVCEDDLRLSPHFLGFMNRVLDTYARDPRVFSVTGYGYAPGLLRIPADYRAQVYLSRRGGSLAWGTWLDRWEKVDWNLIDPGRDSEALRRLALGGADLSPMLRAQLRGEIDSWAIRFAYARARADAYTLVPVRSYVDTTGDDGSGTHGRSAYTRERVDLGVTLADPDLPLDLVPDQRILAGIRRIFAPTPRQRLGHWLKRLGRGNL